MSHIEASKQSYNRTIELQGKKGMEAYGQPMDPMEPGRDWLDMAEQELVDGHQYLVAEKRKRGYCCRNIRNWLEIGEIEKALRWLDKLEGKS